MGVADLKKRTLEVALKISNAPILVRKNTTTTKIVLPEHDASAMKCTIRKYVENLNHRFFLTRISTCRFAAYIAAAPIMKPDSRNKATRRAMEHVRSLNGI
jgi:hypothetical protein